jgi:hypothetical protein
VGLRPPDSGGARRREIFPTRLDPLFNITIPWKFIVNIFNKYYKIVSGEGFIVLGGGGSRWKGLPAVCMLRSQEPTFEFDSYTPTQTSSSLLCLYESNSDRFYEIAAGLRSHQLKVSVTAGKRIKKVDVQDMDALSYVCLKIGLVHGDKAFDLLAERYPHCIATSLLPHASELFTIPRIANLLRPLVVACTDPSLTFLARACARPAAAELASRLFAVYIEHHIAKDFTSELGSAAREKMVQELKNDLAKDAPHLDRKTIHLLASAGVLNNKIITGMDYLEECVFEEATLPLSLQTYTEFSAYFCAGGLRYARLGHGTSMKKHDHAATAIAFGLALGSSIPNTTSFLNLSSVARDANLENFWKSRNYVGFIEYLVADYSLKVTAGLKDESSSASAEFTIQFHDAYNAAKNIPLGHPKVSCLQRGFRWLKF